MKNFEARIINFVGSNKLGDRTVGGILKHKGLTWSGAKILANNKQVLKKFVSG